MSTARGGAVWSTSSVQAVLAGQDAARLIEIRSRPASTTQETIVNTDIHRSRSGLGHRVGATERRPFCVRCSGPQQRPAARHRAADPACRSLRHPPAPDLGRQRADQILTHAYTVAIEPNPRCRSPRSPRRNSQCRRCAPRPLGPRCSWSEWAVQTAPRDVVIGSTAPAVSGRPAARSSSSADAVTRAARTGRSWSASTT